MGYDTFDLDVGIGSAELDGGSRDVAKAGCRLFDKGLELVNPPGDVSSCGVMSFSG
jgi:hypothetical protein